MSDEKNTTQGATQSQADRLTTCPDCGQTVSRRAVTCPGCGCPIAEALSGQIHVTRTFAPFSAGSGAAISVWVDGLAKGEIRVEGQYLEVAATAGPHLVEIRTEKFTASCEVEVIAGQSVELEAGFGMNGVRINPKSARAASSCVIATACTGPSSDELRVLRGIRDAGISSNPIVRDFFHVFWSRYYEYSPAVARIAQEDVNVQRHIRWAFLDPWMAWLELAIEVGTKDLASADAETKHLVVSRLSERLTRWCAEIPEQFEGKLPVDPQKTMDAFEEFRSMAMRTLRM